MRLNRCLNLDLNLFFDNCAALNSTKYDSINSVPFTGNVAVQRTVKIQTLVRGQTFDSHRALLQRVQLVGGLQVEETTSGKVVVVFCPVASRHMTDIEAAMSEVPGNSRFSF